MMPKVLTIKQPKLLKNSYLLLEGDMPAGRLDRIGVFRPKVTASMGTHTWRFSSKNSWREIVIIVTTLDSDEPVATYRRSIFKQTGSLLLDGVEYRLKVSGWRSQYIWNDKDGNPLVTFKFGRSFKRSGTIEIADSLAKVPNYELLLPLGLYLSLEIDDATTAVVASS